MKGFDFGSKGSWLASYSASYEPQWLCESVVLKGGLNILLGAPKARKSHLRRYLLACMLKGVPALGFKTSQIQRALVLIGESALEAEAALMWQVCAALDVKDGGKRVWLEKPLGFNITSGLDLTELVEFVQKHKFDIVILDPLINFHYGEENDAASMGKVCRSLLILAEHTTVLLVHHSAKPSEADEQKTVGQMGRGSSVLAGAADVSLLLQRRGESDAGRLRFETRHAWEPEPLEVMFDGDTGLWLPRDEAPTLESRVREALSLDPTLSGNKLREMLHARRTDVYAALKAIRGPEEAVPGGVPAAVAQGHSTLTLIP